MKQKDYKKEYWSWDKSEYLDWETYKRFCVPRYMIEEYKENLQKRIESLMKKKVSHKQKEIWFT